MRLAHVGVDNFKFCVVWSWTLQTLRVMNLRARDRGTRLLLKGKVHLACAEDDDALIRELGESGANSGC